MSLYNKYRPKNFDQLVSSKYNTPNKEQIKSHHAFLFFGSPGTGKTSSARLYMQEFVKDSEKASVIDGKHPDYVEINCAVNNGVDDIRTIVSDVVNTVPISADYKFIVMDECLDYEAKIELSDGTRESIGKIVKNKLPVSVISYNFEKKCFESKKITNWFQNSKKEVYDWKFRSSNKTFTIRASENHKIFSGNREVRLNELNINDTIKVVKRTTCKTRKKAYDFKTRKFHISDEADFFIRGTLLGDGSASKKNLTRIRFTHSSKQKCWIDVKKRILGDLVTTCKEINNKGYGDKSLVLVTRSCKELNGIYDELYINGKKKITKEYLLKLNPISWAAWFLDDGSTNFSKKGEVNGIALSTHSFTKEENILIQEYFKDYANLDFVLQLDKRKNKWYLRANKESAIIFLQFIAPFCSRDTLGYKFPNNLILRDEMKSFSPVIMSKENHDNDNLYELIDATYIGKTNKKLHGKYTYDIEVEDNHNYIANFVLVHNCHMLTTQSQNALLKTVEEPPKHIKFIFCTTEINKVLPAIRSRCQIVPFIKLNDQLLLKILNNIVDGEQLNANTESLNLIVSCSEGSARNAINLLEQCSLLLTDPKAVANVLGTANSVSFDSLTEAICNKDRVKSLLLLEELITNAIDQNSIINKYADYLADLIILRIVDKSKCKFDGKSLLIISEGITNILKDFKILQNIKLISKIHVLKVIDLL